MDLLNNAAFVAALPVNILILYAMFSDIKEIVCRKEKPHSKKKYTDDEEEDDYYDPSIFDDGVEITLTEEDNRKLERLTKESGFILKEQYLREVLIKTILEDSCNLLDKSS